MSVIQPARMLELLNTTCALLPRTPARPGTSWTLRQQTNLFGRGSISLERTLASATSDEATVRTTGTGWVTTRDPQTYVERRVRLVATGESVWGPTHPLRSEVTQETPDGGMRKLYRVELSRLPRAD